MDPKGPVRRKTLQSTTEATNTTVTRVASVGTYIRSNKCPA